MKVMVLAGFQMDGGREVGKGDVVEVPDGMIPALMQAGRVVPYGTPAAPVTREDAPPATATTTATGTPLIATTRKGRPKR